MQIHTTRDAEVLAVRQYVENTTTCCRDWLLKFFDPACVQPCRSPELEMQLISSITISVIGYDVICTRIILEVKKARFYSIMADEVSSNNTEHLPLCLRFVDDKSE